MKSCEELISSKSNYYIYTPSRQASGMFLYPLQCGIFTYLPGYSLRRESFDSFLLMYLQKGELLISIDSHEIQASSGSFVLIDCYQPHTYSTFKGCECIWCHYDGITARSFYENITERLGNVFTMQESYTVLSQLSSIIKIFQNGDVVKEPVLSRHLNNIMTDFLLYVPGAGKSSDHVHIAEKSVTYINEHFAQNISVSILADMAGVSEFHFIRIFKKETGFTPHEYLVNTRIATAQYLLKNTRLPIKDICYNTGFSCESAFCSSFKKHQGITPSQYRDRVK